MSDSIGTSSAFLMAHEPKFPKQAIVAFFLQGIALFCATAMAELPGAQTLKMSPKNLVWVPNFQKVNLTKDFSMIFDSISRRRSKNLWGRPCRMDGFG